MECPVCYSTKSSKYVYSLDCGHKLCLQCSVQWLRKNATCPCCREKTTLFSKRTRSREVAKQLYKDSVLVWNHVAEYFHVLPPDECIDMLIRYVDFFFMDEENRSYWYRPELQDFKNSIKTFTKHVKDNLEISYPEHEYKIFELFHSV